MNRAKAAAAFLVAIASGAAAPAARADIVPEGGVLDFTVVRDGSDIGTHRITFRRQNERIDVDVVTRIAVKVAFVTVYRFEHDGHEAWQDGRLMSMETKTHDDGKDHLLKVVRNGNGSYRATADGKSFDADGAAVPASLWNPEFVKSGKLMNSLVGTPLRIAVAYKGEEAIPVHGRDVKAKHFSMTGEFERELWYDDHWVLVHMELKGKDGSRVKYVLR
jgi:hypothetical protein